MHVSAQLVDRLTLRIECFKPDLHTKGPRLQYERNKVWRGHGCMKSISKQHDRRGAVSASSAHAYVLLLREKQLNSKTLSAVCC